MRQRAFTLFEVLLVILLLGLLVAFTYPDLSGMMNARSLHESADRLRTLIMMAHAQAMQDGIKYRVQFPGTPDPLDIHAKKEIDVPGVTQQPEVKRQGAPLENPNLFEGFSASWKDQQILRPGTRCVAVFAGQPNFDISSHSPIAGPSVTEGTTTFVPLTFNVDGTSEWVTFVLTDLPFDVDVQSDHVSRIFNVIVDGRTGETWVQRALRVDEVELLREYGASPIFHVDFTSAQEITEANILHVQMGQGGRVSGGARRRSTSSQQ